MTSTGHPETLGVIPELFDQRAKQTPSAVALICRDQRVEYKDLKRRVDALSEYFQTSGVRLGFPVGVCLDNSVEKVALLLAVMKAGGVYVPLDPGYPDKRLQRITECCRPFAVVTDYRNRHRLAPNATRALCFEDIPVPRAGEYSESSFVSIHPGDAAYVRFTSGSTGSPKGVVVLHRSA